MQKLTKRIKEIDRLGKDLRKGQEMTKGKVKEIMLGKEQEKFREKCRKIFKKKWR